MLKEKIKYEHKKAAPIQKSLVMIFFYLIRTNVALGVQTSCYLIP